MSGGIGHGVMRFLGIVSVLVGGLCGGCHSDTSRRQNRLMTLDNAEKAVRTIRSRKEYDAFVRGSRWPLCIMFKSPACGGCREMAPHMERVASRYSGKVHFASVSLVEVDGVGRDLRILGTPTTIVFRNGKEVERFVGPMTDEGLRGLVESAR